MGSHYVSCHTTQMNVPHLSLSQAICLPQRDAKNAELFSVFIMGPSFIEGGPIMYRCCPSVCLSVLCLHLEGKQKGLRIPNLVGRVPGSRAPRGPISRSRGQRSRSRRLICVVGEKSTTTKARSPCSVVKSKWFTRWQHFMSPCGSTHVVNCKDGPIEGGPSTAAPTCYISRWFTRLQSPIWVVTIW